MNDRFNRYLATATAALEAGFLSKAAQQRALEDVSRAWREARESLTDSILSERAKVAPDVRDYEELNKHPLTALYYSVPFDLHCWRPHHAEACAAFPETMPYIEEALQLRLLIKAAPIQPKPEADPFKARKAEINKSLMEIMAHRQDQFARGLRLTEIFKTLPVSINTHWVSNPVGEDYLRTFFYLRGELTTLNVIIAILDATREDA